MGVNKPMWVMAASGPVVGRGVGEAGVVALRLSLGGGRTLWRRESDTWYPRFLPGVAMSLSMVQTKGCGAGLDCWAKVSIADCTAAMER